MTTVIGHDDELDRMIGATAEDLFRDRGGVDRARLREGDEIDSELWETVVELGFPALGVPDEGGSNESLAYLCTVVRAAARNLALVPLIEASTAIWLAHEVHEAPADGISTVALGARSLDGETTARRVPFARDASTLMLVEQDRIGVADRKRVTVRPGTNLAGEPRDDVSVPEGDVRWSSAVGVGERARARLALLRSASILGALEATEGLVVAHVRGREQFGAPLARLPVVRERLAVLVESVALAGASVAVARRAATVEDAAYAAASAKVVTSRAAGTVVRIAHQLHGAIGVTAEHPLHHYTRRLTAWRDEDGSEREWARWSGLRLAERGTGGLWQEVVALSSAERPE